MQKILFRKIPNPKNNTPPLNKCPAIAKNQPFAVVEYRQLEPGMFFRWRDAWFLKLDDKLSLPADIACPYQSKITTNPKVGVSSFYFTLVDDDADGVNGIHNIHGHS